MRLRPISDPYTSTHRGAPLDGAVPTVVSPGGPARILRVDQVMARTALSRTTLWRLERRGAFPARRQLSPGTVGWIEAEVEAWILGRLTRAAGGAGGRTRARLLD
jgi:prophage regulatory protein